MSRDPRTRAEERLESALAERSARDHRELYRERLKELRARDPNSFRVARAYYDQTLVPRVADPANDPIAEWLEYGRYLAQLLSPGDTVQIDRTGLSAPFNKSSGADNLILHLPKSAGDAAIPVGIPMKPSPAQLATYELLVRTPLD